MLVTSNSWVLLHVPIGCQSVKSSITISFDSSFDFTVAADLKHYSLKAWDLERSANYGSKHINERMLKITNAKLEEDGRTLILMIPDLAPPRGMELLCTLKGTGGIALTRRFVC